MRLAAALLLAAFTSGAQAGGGEACTEDIEAALRALGGRSGMRGEVTASDCRPWPAAPGRLTAAVMAFEKPGSGAGDDREWQVVVALVDPTRRKTLSSHQVKLREDATTLLGSQSLSLDLAPYLLRPGVRALGLRFSSDRSNNVANSRSGPWLHLYVPEGPRLRPVFCQAMGWQDAGLGVIGQDPWNEAQTTLSVLDPQASGWRRLRLTDQISRQKPDGEAGKPEPSHRECRFDAGTYRCDPPQSDAITACDPSGL